MEYLYRPLISLIEATTTPVAEHEFHAFLPPGVWLSTCRVPFFELSQSGLGEMMKNITEMSRMVSTVPLDLIVVLSMTGTCLRGPELRNILQQRTGVSTITAAQAVVEITQRMGWKRLQIISNYNPELAFVERVFFNSHGIDVEVFSAREQRLATGREVVDISLIDMDKLFSTLEHMDKDRADAYFFDAPFFNVTGIWKEIESRVQKPIFTLNQVVLYTALKTLGQPTNHLLIPKYLD